MKIVVDSYAWIELFIGSERGEKVKKIISDADDVFVPDIVLAEIARKYIREGVSEDIVRDRIRRITDIARVISVDEEISLLSAKFYMELLEKSKAEKLQTPSLADAIVLAITRFLRSKLLTGDKHFRGFKEIIWIGE